MICWVSDINLGKNIAKMIQLIGIIILTRFIISKHRGRCRTQNNGVFHG